MKFNEKYEQMQKESDTRRLLEAFEESVDFILLNQQQAVSFQLAYDHVFKLTKLGRQNDVLNLLDDKLAVLLKGKLAAQKKQNLESLAQLLREVRAVSDRMTQICLFLDMNYCQKVMHLPLKKRLRNNIFKNFTSDSKPLGVLARAAFEARNDVSAHFKQILTLIDEIDEKEEFFEQHLIPHYIPLVSEHYSKAAAELWKKESLRHYVDWCRGELEKEEKFLEGALAKKKRREGVEAVISCIYQAVVTEYKQKMYQTDETELFEQMSLPILELLKFGRGKEVESHIQWFMGALEKRLNLISFEDNTQFIDDFCRLYQRVADLLKGTQSKFQINYRSVFTFQEWINNQKFNIPLRLNILIDERFTSASSSAFPEFLCKVILVFKLVKEKNLFQTLYRRTMINRLIHRYLTYDLAEQYKLIEAMQCECGEEWGSKVKSICDLYDKDRNKFIRTRKVVQPKEEDNYKIGGLVPLVISENDWPFENRNNKIKINDQLLVMTGPFQQEYLPESTKHKLWWSSKVGTVTLSIKFLSHRRDFLVSVDMANLLLYLQDKPKKLTYFLCEHCYAIDQVEEFLQTLLSHNLVRSQADGNDYWLALPEECEKGPMVDLMWAKKGGKLEVKVMEELKSDRKLMVEAILVKIMKGEKVCKREELIDKSAPLVTQRGFKFNMEFVEKSVDRLIDKEFIRDFEDGTLGYIA